MNKGEYIFTNKDANSTTMEPEKPLSEVEKAQASVNEWKTKVETYEKELHFAETVDILVRAYLNNTLVHGNCYACAVGNIVVARNGYHYTKCVDDPGRKVALSENKGCYSFGDVGGNWYSCIDGKYANDIETNTGEKEIESTGYTFNEVVKIERAFEGAFGDPEERMFNGLMAVVDVLADIHGIDLKSKEEAKLLFC